MVAKKPVQSSLDRCVNVFDVENLARRKMRRGDYDYYAGGSEDERTLEGNRSAFGEAFLRPRVLVDVSRIDPSTAVLGAKVSTPILLAPTALQKIAHPDGELATARAAGEAGTLMVASTTATYSLEEIAAAATGPLWFQLYVYKERSIARRLIQRAEAAGYRALVLTVDTAQLGRRERDARNRFTLPRGIRMRNFEDVGLDVTAGATFAAYASQTLDPSLTWDAVDWLKHETKLPIVLKGIIAAEDAARAAELGVSGIVVSNHGGRQLDGAEPTIRALPRVVDAVRGRAEVYMDGGVRRGTDVVKALALGARAVFIGRPYLWGLAAGGEKGVSRVLTLLRQELELAMTLCGTPTVAAIERSLIAATCVA